MGRAIVVAIAALIILAAPASPATLRNVPADFPTIQAAINVSAYQDTVMVAQGTYIENLDFGSRTIRVLGSGGSAVTILQPNPVSPGSPLIRFSGGGSETEFSGFTLDGGSMKHAIEINASQPWIHHNVIANHVSYEANATEIGSYAGTPAITFNLFIHNRSIGGVGIFSGGGQILNNTFNDCSRGFWSQGVGVIAKNNIVTNSVQFGIADNGFATADYNCAYNNNPNYDYGAVPGANDIQVSPEYCDASSDNYGLDAISPCLATGEGGADRGAYGLSCGADSGPRVLSLTVSGSLVMHVIGDTPEISWTYYDIGGQLQTDAEIEVGTNPDWAVAEMWDPPLFAGSAPMQTYAGAPFLDGTTYYVRARVNNGIEWGDWTARSFRTNTPPPAPVPNSPGVNAIVSISTPSLQVSTTSDAEGDALFFAFQVYSDELLTQLVGSANGQGSSWTVSPPLTLENNTYRWRARSNDGYEYSQWSAVSTFTLDMVPTPPTAGLLLEPVGNIPVPTTAPFFDWTDAIDPDPGPITQTLYVATDADFVFATQFGDLPASEFLYGGLSVAQRYWWKVRFTDDNGQWTETPAAQFFIPGPGDMSMNQTLNLVDVVMLTDVVFRGVPEPAASYLADVNGDCVLDVTDVVALINHVFRNAAVPLSLCITPSNMLRVPTEYATIAIAISAAVDEDTVLVAPGIYRENVSFMGKRIHLLSEGGAEVTRLEPSVLSDPTVRFIGGEPTGTELTGFTVTGGTAQHAIIVTSDSYPYIHHNIIRDHVTFSYNATAIGSYLSAPVIEYNLFIHTRSLGGIGIFTGGGTIQNNTFDDNSRGYWSQGSGVIALNNIVTNSVDFGIGGDDFAVNDYNCVFNNNSEYCCGAVPGPNDLNAFPGYCNPATEDYRLGPTSLCLGSGFGGFDRGASGPGCAVR